MPIHKGVRQLVEEANAEIRCITASEAIKMAANDDVEIVDLRDIRERQRDGFIQGSFHAPRGMLEFWVDPQSPYYKDFFGQDKTYVFHCASGWRSALATRAVQDMGLDNAAHIVDGYRGWTEAGGRTIKTDSGKEDR